MANSTRLRSTELDFDEIKQNLKDFLSSQSEFTDYNFEGSALATLLDIIHTIMRCMQTSSQTKCF